MDQLDAFEAYVTFDGWTNEAQKPCEKFGGQPYQFCGAFQSGQTAASICT
jgi:hypothetical protein